jgi:hypothetical protein
MMIYHVKNLYTGTPMFPLEVFRQKEGEETLEKYLQQTYLKSWITTINI